MKLGKIAALALTLTSPAFAGTLNELNHYGKGISASAHHNIQFVRTKHTSSSPFTAYALTFRTNKKVLMAAKDAQTNHADYVLNLGKTKIWQIKFCTDSLKKIMAVHQIDIVTGDLQNMKGETQSLALCSD